MINRAKAISHSQFRGKYQGMLADMTEKFLTQVLDKPEEEVLRVYEHFCREWTSTVESVNKRHGAFVLAHESWRNIWERDGYRNIVTKPIAPEEKKVILRIIFIVEGLTENQRARRELKYKFFFIGVRIRHWFRKLRGIDVSPKSQPAAKPQMQAVK